MRVTLDEYTRLLAKQTDQEKRRQMKAIAFAAMYSGDPDATVLLPEHLIPSEKDKDE